MRPLHGEARFAVLKKAESRADRRDSGLQAAKSLCSASCSDHPKADFSGWARAQLLGRKIHVRDMR
jgi:hypothetical protein